MDQAIVVALGSNQALGQAGPAQLLDRALDRFEGAGVRVQRVSRYFGTPCFPAGAGPDYVNAAAVIQTALTPQALLGALHGIEADLGRERRARWAARTVDIDLIAYGQQVLPDMQGFAAWHDLPLERQQQEAPDRLILPHPRMHERGFVLVPVLDVAPDWKHPVLGRTVRQMVADLPPEALKEVRAL